MRHKDHYAIRELDEFYCPKCGKRWDVREQAPACTRRNQPVIVEPAPVLPLPSQLTGDLERAMEMAYRRDGMQAAYRVLLDRLGA